MHLNDTTVSYVTEFAHNAALVAVVVFLHRVMANRFSGPAESALSGLLFGGGAVLSMMAAIAAWDGVIFDARTVVLSVGALFGGPVVAAISATIAAAYWIYLGGQGTVVGVLVIATATAAGLVLRHRYARDFLTVNVWLFLALGLVVHVTAVVWFALLPLDYVEQVLKGPAPAYVGILTLGTVATGLLLREIERTKRFDSILRDSHERLQNLFDTTGIALIEEDVSGVFRALCQLRDSGVTDLRAHLDRNPALVDELAGKVRILQGNPAATRLFRVTVEEGRKAGIGAFFGPGARDSYVDELCALWSGAPQIERETVLRTGDGTELTAFITIPLPDTEEQARHVAVSILDLTALRNTERQAMQERERLREVVWGTDVGTWEWNVQTGQTIFNDRWAEIVGYTLAELEPISIDTWERLAHPDDLSRSGAILEDVFARKLDAYECEARMRHKNGTWIWVLDRGKVVEWAPDGSPLRMSGTHMDITARKLAELRAEHLSSVRETLLRCHADILAARSEVEIFERTVATLVEARGYALAWIGVPEDGPDKLVRPVARAGIQSSYVDGIEVHWSDDAFGQGPTGRAIRTGEIQVLDKISHDDNFDPWREKAENHSLVSSLAVPISADGRVIAALNLYSTVPAVFDSEEIGLLQEFAQNVGQAVQTLRLQAERTRLHSELGNAALGAVTAIAATIEKRDPYTAGHQESVAALSVAIGKKLGWDEFKLQGLRLGAMIHDIGKISVPSEILNRPGSLSEPEFAIIKSHAQVGYEILAKTSFPWPIKEMVHQHHERLDGSGYPNRLRGDQIIDEAKVIGVADVVDAILSHRPYRPSRGVAAALAEIERGRGTLYEPSVVDACLALVREDGYSLDKP